MLVPLRTRARAEMTLLDVPVPARFLLLRYEDAEGLSCNKSVCDLTRVLLKERTIGRCADEQRIHKLETAVSSIVNVTSS